MRKTAKNKSANYERLSLNLTPEQSVKFNTYIINVGKKQGRIPWKIKTKILRAALDEWFENHGNDYDIDWTKEEKPRMQKAPQTYGQKQNHGSAG